jgi:hypothetical protein
MKMRLIYFFLLIFPVFLFTTNIRPQTKDGISHIEKDVCPFEGCQFGKWIIKDTINVYTKEGDTASIKYTLEYDDTVIAITGNIHYENFGKVLVTKTFDDFEVNDTILVLRCTEGEFICYYKGKETTKNLFWPINYDDNENEKETVDKEKYFGRIIEEPQFTWWVKISRKGNVGWLSLKNQNPYCFQLKEKIEGMDSLY